LGERTIDMRSNCFKAYYGSLLHFHHICLQTYFVILLPTAFVVHLKFPVAPQCSGAGPLLKGTSPRPLEKILPRWKCVNTDFMRNRCFRACYRCKIRTPLRKHFIPLMSQAGYGPVLEALNLKKACKVILVAVHWRRVQVSFVEKVLLVAFSRSPPFSDQTQTVVFVAVH